MLEFLGEIGAPTVVVLTKIDKLRTTELKQRIISLTTALRTGGGAGDSVQHRDEGGTG